MALDLATTYPGQIDESDPDYPTGKAQNVVVEGDGTGTPLEETWLNDLFGFQQALLAEADITPSGDADTAVASQYLEAVQWLSAASVATVNVKHPKIGAAGDGVTDDTAELQAAIDAVEAVGGGRVICPASRYRTTAQLNLPRIVDLVGMSGLSIIAMDHATAKTLVIEDGDRLGEQLIEGMRFEADQTNTGIVIQDSLADSGTVRLRNVVINSEGLYEGVLLSGAAGIKHILEDPTIVSSNESGHGLQSADLELHGGALTMDPEATDSLIGPCRLLVNGTSFTQISLSVVTNTFIDASLEVTRVDNAIFTVDDSGAGASTCAIDVAGGTLFTNGNRFVDDAIPYLRTSMAAEGSRLQLLPALRIETGVGDDVTLPAGYESFIVEAAKPTAPSVTPVDALFMGQRATLALRNVSGGVWAGNPTTVGVLDSTTGLSGLADDGYITYSWVALDIDDDGSPTWTQSAAPGVI